MSVHIQTIPLSSSDSNLAFCQVRNVAVVAAATAVLLVTLEFALIHLRSPLSLRARWRTALLYSFPQTQQTSA